MKKVVFGVVLAVATVLVGDTLAWAWDSSGRTVDGAVEGTTVGQALDAAGGAAGASAGAAVEVKWSTVRESDGIAFDSRPPQGMFFILR